MIYTTFLILVVFEAAAGGSSMIVQSMEGLDNRVARLSCLTVIVTYLQDYDFRHLYPYLAELFYQVSYKGYKGHSLNKEMTMTLHILKLH